jgi:hypothetical protein
VGHPLILKGDFDLGGCLGDGTEIARSQDEAREAKVAASRALLRDDLEPHSARPMSRSSWHRRSSEVRLLS